MADVASRSQNHKRALSVEVDTISQDGDGSADIDEWDDDDLDDDPSSYDGYEASAAAPEVGMLFSDHMEVTRFYKRYARRLGFGVSVRRSSFSPEGQCLFLELSCCRAGRKRPDPMFRRRALSSTNCLARIRAKLWDDGMLHLEVANVDHNHPVNPSMARFLNCHKPLPTTGIGRKHIYDALEDAPPPEDHDAPPFDRFGGLGELLFGESDHRSFVNRGRLRLSEGDAESLRLFFTRMQAKNANFYHVVDLDEEGCLRSVFWADAWSRAAYEYYGDVVAVDTTYITGKFDIPLVLFVGTDHHGHPVLLGCGLLSDETVDTYIWLLKAWLASMSGRLPGAVITDQSRNIQSAVVEVLPSVRHRFCLGQVMKRVTEKLGGLSEFRTVSKVFQSAVFDSLRREEFEKDWLRMMEVYGLQGNEWLSYLYDCRHLWVPVYLKDTFWAGMSITQRGDTLCPFFEGYVDAKTTIKMFLGKYETTLESKYEKEAQADFETFHKRRPSVSKFLMEEQLSQVYTLNLFKKFQDEIEQIMYCHATPVNVDGPISTFDVKECIFLEDGKKSTTMRNHGVLFNTEEKEVQCICGSFQFRGILCRHALSVFKLQQVHEIPPQYVLDRWKKDFKKLQVAARPSEDLVPKTRLDRYDYLTMRCLELVELGVVSGKYPLALKLLREVEKFLNSDKTYDDTVPKIVSHVPKAQKGDPIKKLLPAENSKPLRALPALKDVQPLQQTKGKKLPNDKQAQGGACQVPLIMPKGMNQGGYVFQFVPTMPPLRPPEGTKAGTAPPQPFPNNLGVPMPLAAANQTGARPFVYMLPGGVDPKALGNTPMMPLYYPQMYQVQNGGAKVAPAPPPRPPVPATPVAGQRPKRRRGRPSRQAEKLKGPSGAANQEAGGSNEQDEIMHAEDEANEPPAENSQAASGDGGGGDA